MNSEFSNVSRYIIVTAALVIVIAGVKQSAPLLIPFLLSIFIAVLCMPAIHALKSYGLSQGIALSVVIFSVFSFGFLLVVLVGGSVNEFSAAIPMYQEKINGINAHLLEALNSQGIVLSQSVINEHIDTSSIMQMVANIVSGFGNVLANSFLILVTVIFLLLESGRFSEKFGLANEGDENNLQQSFTKKLRLYMGIKTWMSIATGLLVTVWLWLLNIDYPQLWGVLAFLLNFIPNIGSIIAAAPAVLLALVQFDVATSLLVATGYIVINVVVGNVIEPRYLGKGLDLSTLIVFLSLVFWGWILGPVGMVLSVPLTISVKLALDESAETRWLGDFLGR